MKIELLSFERTNLYIEQYITNHPVRLSITY